MTGLGSSPPRAWRCGRKWRWGPSPGLLHSVTTRFEMLAINRQDNKVRERNMNSTSWIVIAVLTLFALLVTGCAGPTVYDRAGWADPPEPGQFHRDKAQCIAMARGGETQVRQDGGDYSTSGAGGMAAGLVQGMNLGSAMAARRQQQAVFDACMKGRGWTPVE